MWIFGYGSLVWKADFPYIKKVVGYVKGYERKFYQASIDHRGVPEKPGRVVTLIPSEDTNSRVWGVVYKIHKRDVDFVIKHLDMREVMGYEKVPAEFFPIPNHPLNIFDSESSHSIIQVTTSTYYSPTLEEDTLKITGGGEREVDGDSGLGSFTSEEPQSTSSGDTSDSDSIGSSSSDEDEFDVHYGSVREGRPFVATMYFGAMNNEHYIGAASLSTMALEIYEGHGGSGSNREYLFKLAEAMREICTEALDGHLMELEEAVRTLEVGPVNHTTAPNAL